MQTEELRELVYKIQKQKTEKQTVELKEAHEGFPKIFDTLSSFSNQDEGGVIVFGISEKKKYQVVGVYDPVDVQKKITEACNQMEPKVRALVTICEIEDMYVVSAEIPGVDLAERPVYYKGTGIIKGSYIRVGEADEHMTHYEIYSFEAYKKRNKDDMRPVTGSRVGLFDQERLDTYFRNIKQDRKNLAENVTESEILEMMGATVDGVPTLAGILTFSRYPQTWFPQLCITAVVIPGLEMGDQSDEGMRFIDNRRITGAIPDMVEEAVDFVKKNSRMMTVIDDNGERNDRPEYPVRAVREAILNALIHRDYSQYTENTPVSIEMYRDRIVFRSSGGLFGRANVKMLGKSRPESRNAALLNMLEVLHVTENRYSGIPTMFHELQKYHMPDPVFENSLSEFAVTFRNTIYLSETGIDMTDLSEAILAYCKVPRSRRELVMFSGKSQYYTMSKIVLPLVREGKLLLTIPEKPQSSKQTFVAADADVG